MKAAAVLWLPALCLGEVPRASLLQLGSLSKSARGASLAASGAGEARGFTSTLAGFQKYADQLVDTFMKTGVSPTDSNQVAIVALIVNYINVDMFNALWTLHEADQSEVVDCQAKNTQAMLDGLEFYEQACGPGDGEGSRQDVCGYEIFGERICITTSDGTQDCQTGETEMWRERDRAAYLRKVHKTCVETNKAKDQVNDVNCRRYNKYRGTEASDAGSNQLDGYIHEDANEDFMTYTEMQAMCTYSDLGLSVNDGAGFFYDECCGNSKSCTSAALCEEFCPEAGVAKSVRENTLSISDQKWKANGASDEFSLNRWTVTGTANPSTKTGETHSVYPSCATKAGSIWIAIQQSLATSSHSFLNTNDGNYRVDGRVWMDKFWVEGDLSSPMIRSEDMDARGVMEACLEAVNLWFHPLYHYYLKCNADQEHTNYKECLTEQNDYEKMVCSWRSKENEKCDEYDKCIADAVAKCSVTASGSDHTCSHVDTKILARKADYETGQRIVCLLDVLIGKVGEEGGVGTSGDAATASYDNATAFARKREYLESCKNKQTNNNDDVNRFYARKVADKNVDDVIRVYGSTLAGYTADGPADYTLTTADKAIKQECMTRVCGYHSLVDNAGATNLDPLNHKVLGDNLDNLDDTLARQNATRRTSETASVQGGATETNADCTIDTEQWEMLIPCGSNPPLGKEYPKTFCLVVEDDEHAGTGSEAGTYELGHGTHAKFIEEWTGNWETNIGVNVDADLVHTTDTTIPRWKPSDDGWTYENGKIPSYFVEKHSTVVDNFTVPCSADFFLDAHWGYVDSPDLCQPSTGGTTKSDICAGTTFEPTLSIADTHDTTNALGGNALKVTPKQGVPLHLKLYPRRQIMQKDHNINDENNPGAAGPYITGPRVWKQIEVPAAYRLASTSALSSNAENRVWWAFFNEMPASEAYDTVEERSKAQGATYDACGTNVNGCTSSTIDFVFRAATTDEVAKDRYDQVFEIYASEETYSGNYQETTFRRPDLAQTTSYPDHFSYGWCVKCHGEYDDSERYMLKYKSESDSDFDADNDVAGLRWYKSSKAQKEYFAGNCEAQTLQFASTAASSAKLTGVKGKEVQRFDSTNPTTAVEQNLALMKKYMPAYHPHACRLHDTVKGS